MRVITQCPFCGGFNYVDNVDPIAFHRWESGELIQNAFPRLSAEDRELLKTGTCPTCWNLTLGEENEEDE